MRNAKAAIIVDRDLLEEIRDYLAQPLRSGGSFPMETHRAEADGVDHLLSGINEVLQEETRCWQSGRREPTMKLAREIAEKLASELPLAWGTNQAENIIAAKLEPVREALRGILSVVEDVRHSPKTALVEIKYTVIPVLVMLAECEKEEQCQPK